MTKHFLCIVISISFLSILCSGCFKLPEEPVTTDIVPGQLYGFIYLEKQSSHAGTQVSLNDTNRTTVYTDTTGVFCFFDIPPGKYTITAYHEWFEPETLKDTTISSYESCHIGYTYLLVGEPVVKEGTELSWLSYSKRFVFTRYISDSPHLFIYNLDKNKETDLNHKGKSPFWSPTGTFIAYEGENGGIYRINSDGTNAMLISDLGSKPVVSSDGTKILFFREEPSDSGVYIINADGTGIISIDSIGKNPDIASDNNHIVYERNGEIVLTTLDALNEKIIIGSGSNPKFSPTEEMVAFIDQYLIFVIDYEGNEIYSEYYFYITTIQWNPYGSYIVFSTDDNRIFCWNLIPDNRNTITANGNNPVCSPDGKTLLFERNGGIRKFKLN